mmetsp:Transcript_76277/g.202567  ORF Transcript_76277/g.202567 Transcript_76277/m.202567 type:complete len:216 (-) Transcript_76277:56-703(-)
MMHSEEQFAADERMARALQNAELGQHRQEDQRQVVQGVPVNQTNAPPSGQIVVGVTANSGPSAATAVVIAGEPPMVELVVLNYRLAVSCFATVDLILTLVKVVSAVRGFDWRLLWLLLLIGPLCGIASARTLNRGLALVYLVFCFFQVALQIALAVLLSMLSTMFSFLWYFFMMMIQVWITKVVCAFWQALGAISPERRKELAPCKDLPGTLVFW